jgi:hypothetical protein
LLTADQGQFNAALPRCHPQSDAPILKSTAFTTKGTKHTKKSISFFDSLGALGDLGGSLLVSPSPSLL